MMDSIRSWFVLAGVCTVLLGGCTAMAGGLSHWPASLTALALMVAGKIANDRRPLLKWPMEFVFWSAIGLIACNLVYLHFKPL